MIGYLRAEYIKMRHRGFVILHILAPLCLALVFLSYYSLVKYDSNTEYLAYIQVVGMAFPFMISLVCAMSLEEEEKAARYYHLFGNEHGAIWCFVVKYIVLAGLGLLANAIAIGIFNLGSIKLGAGLSLKQLVLTVLIQFLGVSLLYPFHLALQLYFGKGISLIIGGVESLVAALFLTALGDHLWYFVPASYGVRFPSYYRMMGYMEEIQKGCFGFLGMMLLIWSIFIISVKRYER